MSYFLYSLYESMDVMWLLYMFVVRSLFPRTFLTTLNAAAPKVIKCKMFILSTLNIAYTVTNSTPIAIFKEKRGYMSKKKQIRLEKDSVYTLVTPQSYESLADFIVKNGEYKFVKDYEYLSKEGVGFKVSANVLTVRDCIFDVSELTKQHHPETGVYLTLLKGSLEGDKDSMWVIQFQRCQFYTMLDKANPNAHTAASLCLNENCVFKSCKFYHGAQIRTKKLIAFIDCNFADDVLVDSDARDSSCRLDGLDYNEQLFLKLGYFSIVDIVNAKGLPKKFCICDSCNITFTDCKIQSNSTTFIIAGMYAGYRDNVLYFKNCEINEPLYIDSSKVCFNAINSNLEKIRITRSLVSLLYADSKSNVDKMACSKCVFVKDNDLKTYTHENLNLFPTESVGYGQFNSLTLYKKVYAFSKFDALIKDFSVCKTEVIVELDVPRSAERHIDLASGKIRVNEAVVICMYTFDDQTHALKPYEPDIFTTVRSLHDKSFKYQIGKTVKPKFAFDTSDADCGSGIHGFLTQEEAINYG